MACAWAGVAAYGTSMLLSYFIGQRYYPISYPIKDMAIYTLLAIVLFGGIQLANAHLSFWGALIVNTLLILLFMAYIIKKDLPLRMFRV